jgi:serine/threonine protein kinase
MMYGRWSRTARAADFVEQELDLDEDFRQSLKTVTSPTKMFVGTPTYAAPERFLEGVQLTFASDIWSLAAMLFESVAGEPPFGRIRDPVAAAAAIFFPISILKYDRLCVLPFVRFRLQIFAKRRC